MSPPLLLDVVLSSSLLLSSLVLFFRSRPIHSTASSTPPPSPTSLPSLLHALTTTHIRLLPTPARHAFKYPLLYFGIDVEDLELGRLDLPGGFVSAFGYEPLRSPSSGPRPGFRVTRIRENGYLAPSVPFSKQLEQSEAIPAQPLRSKLLTVLSAHLDLPIADVADKAGRIYLVTMPSFLGLEGINPLSVWFVYSPVDSAAAGGLWVVVLEVHNTFGERHVYVLECGKGEDAKTLG